MKLSLSIVIPSYKGLALLKKHLPSVVSFAKESEIIVLNDSQDSETGEWIKKKFPQIKFIQNKQNLGFSETVNKGFKLAKSDLVLLLNNDVSIKKDTIKHLRKHFEDKTVFAVGALEKLPKKGQRGRSLGSFNRGLLIHSAAQKLSAGPTLWVFAASGMFNRKIWNKLGGLDVLYKPAYWEDIDIGYRAWKSGFKCLFEPSAIVKHEAEATMNSALGGKKAAYAFKNQLLFFWKNVTDTRLIVGHILWTPYHLILTTWRSNGAFLLGFFMALTQLDQVTDQENGYKDKLSDREILSLIKESN